ncbi:MAG: antitoxin family protein [Methanospirillaceae archaeon]|nr:antitoxin family protein [Methanospirillaceae archaeon]
MGEIIEAIYEDGVFKPLKKPDIAEKTKTTIIIQGSITRKTKGIIPSSSIEKIIEEIEDESIF